MTNSVPCLLGNANDNWEVGFVDGQLLPHGGSHELILAVTDGHEGKIREALHEESNLEKRQKLARIICRIAPIIGRNR